LRIQRLSLVLLLALLFIAVLTFVPPAAEATSPEALVTFSGSLGPGEFTDPPLSWQLNRNVDEYLFHYIITGGSSPDDVLYVSIDIGDNWQSLKGEGWSYCADCFLDAGPYSVVVEADAAASTPITYEIGFYLVPQAPVDFSGRIPADSSTRLSDFKVLYSSAGSRPLVLGVSSGSYEFFVDNESQGEVSAPREVTLNLPEGPHVFEVNAETVGAGENVVWSVQIQGEPKLEVAILNTCPTLNPEQGVSTCVTGAEATASDGSSPTVSYWWTASGGTFNSTTSQWVEWTAPAGVAAFTLSVEASAPGYISGTVSLEVQVIPEFPQIVLPFLLVVALAMALFARRSRIRLDAPSSNGRQF
jgi:hypothetical protein